MPLFNTTKFTLKKLPKRRKTAVSNFRRKLGPPQLQTEFGLQCGPVELQLGSHRLQFKDGEWISAHEGAETHSQELEQLTEENKVLQEENNRLRLKVEVLLDMVATAELRQMKMTR
ncbi:protein chibby homolog 1-like [Ornithodoros turicata]|uniref:protein chibby homolog 1-like n=1 Tax=Ornithodoros turicata TaxID=34597 RepID=UPI00313A33C3